MHITSPAGTDVTYELGQYPVITQYGYTDQPGRWDHLAGGFLFTGARDGGVNGTVVIAPGDIILPWKRYMSFPIRLEVEGGTVVAIEGDNPDAELLRSYMARFNDPRAYGVSHIGWGMDEKAQWDFLATSPLAAQSSGLDARAFYGNVLFSTGPNSELGGTNDTACHLDIPLRGCSLTLDNEPIVTNGRLIPAELRVPHR
jgi:2,5-dihydroxypyridine 5,6-dioxygenase